MRFHSEHMRKKVVEIIITTKIITTTPITAVTATKKKRCNASIYTPASNLASRLHAPQFSKHKQCNTHKKRELLYSSYYICHSARLSHFKRQQRRSKNATHTKLYFRLMPVSRTVHSPISWCSREHFYCKHFSVLHIALYAGLRIRHSYSAYTCYTVSLKAHVLTLDSSQ